MSKCKNKQKKNIEFKEIYGYLFINYNIVKLDSTFPFDDTG